MQVNTVLGPVEPSALGITLPHEHLFVDLYRVTRFRDRLLMDIDLITEEAGLFKAAGGGTIVDVTPPDLGRDPRSLQEVSRRTGLHVVMATGRYREPWFEREIWRRTTADIAREFVEEIENGVEGIKPGIIGEIAADDYFISPAEERVHRAAARAQRATGLPITTHSISCPLGLAQLDLFEEEGVDLRRVVIGHVDSYPVLDYHEAVIRRGAFVQFDLIRGLPGYTYDEKQQIRMICELVRGGHVDHILMSHDICTMPWLAMNGGPGYAYIPKTFVGKLLAAGVGSEAIATITVDNPRRMLGGDA